VGHSAGLMPRHFEELGCGFAGALSYKSMYGPYAAGALWARPESASRIALRFAGNRSEAFLDEQRLVFELKPTFRRFEYGPWAWPLVHAWAAAVEYIDRLDRSAIWERTSGLAARLKDHLASIAGVNVLTPCDPHRSAGLVTFTIEGVRGAAASQWLRDEHNVRLKHVPSLPNGLRASMAFFNLESEVDLLLRCVGELARRVVH